MQWILMGFALLALLELPPLIRKGQRNAVVTFLVVFSLALALGLLQDAGITIPSVFTPWERLLRTLGLYYH